MHPSIMHEVLTESKTKGSSKLLLMAIASHGLISHPSITRLAKLTGLNESQVYRLLPTLAQGGHLAIEKGGGPKGGNRYTILRPWSTLHLQDATPRKMRGELNLKDEEEEKESSPRKMRPLAKCDPSPERIGRLLEWLGVSPTSSLHSACLNGHARNN